ncbi:MAG TPA: protease modulator HflC [Candidatus Binatia bacterium]|jgi:membrane protease subunit HflC|nr:protease modulator HflC [Candidatus Binatia bacterium]
MTKLYLLLGAIVVLVGLACLSPFVVDETSYSVVTRLGRPIRTYTEPGLKFRVPLIDQVTNIDSRMLLTEPPATEYLTLDKKNIIARSFVTWRVADPLRFLQTVVVRDTAEQRLAAVTGSELGSAFGAAPFDALVSTEPAHMRLDEIVDGVEQRVRATAAREFGIELVALRLERLAFPQQNEASVYQRMRAERQRIAKQFRSEGEEQALKIRAEADRERSHLLSDANRTATEIRGRAEAEAATIYADALGANPDFYKFVRTLEAYEKIIDKDTTLVMPADSPLMKSLLEGPPAGGIVEAPHPPVQRSAAR